MATKVKAPKAKIIVGPQPPSVADGVKAGIAQGNAHGLTHNGGQPAPTGQPGPTGITIIQSPDYLHAPERWHLHDHTH